jgi:hypothetical protein
MLIEKDVLGPDEVWYTDDAGQPAKIVFTPADVKHLHDQGNAMLAAGLTVPAPLEHDRSLAPKKMADWNADLLRNNAGWVQEYKIKDGRLKAMVDVTDPKAAAKVKEGSVKWTSPWINSFLDGDGKQWNGVISHLALTSRPRAVRQQPFPSTSLALSLAQSAPFDPRTLPTQGIFVSRAGTVSRANGTAHPVFPRAFSLWAGGALLAMDELEVKEKKPAPKKPDAPPAPGADKPPDPAAPKPDAPGDPAAEPGPDGSAPGMDDPLMASEPSVVDGDGDIPVYTVLADLLHTLEVHMPEGTNEANFFHRLYTALMDKIKGMGSQPPDVKPLDKPKAGMDNPIIQEQPPMMMSLEQVNAITDPMQKQLAQALLSLQEQSAKDRNKVKALETQRIADATRTRQQRIDALAKRVPAAAREKLLAQCKGVALSLDDAGAVVDPMETTIAMLELSLPDIPSLMLSGDGLIVQPHPRDSTGATVDDKRAEEIAEELARAAGCPPMKKAS